jgi:hypothetical protein
MRRNLVVKPTQTVLIHDSTTGVTRQLDNAATVQIGYTRHVGDWFMCSGNDLVLVLEEHKVTNYKALALALHMYTIAEIGTNKVRRSLSELSKYLNVDVPYTSRMVKVLVGCGVCVKEQNGLYFMNPTYGWKGTAKQAEGIQAAWNLLTGA